MGRQLGWEKREEEALLSRESVQNMYVESQAYEDLQKCICFSSQGNTCAV